jgi:hypothetical protein
VVVTALVTFSTFNLVTFSTFNEEDGIFDIDKLENPNYATRSALLLAMMPFVLAFAVWGLFMYLS